MKEPNQDIYKLDRATRISKNTSRNDARAAERIVNNPFSQFFNKIGGRVRKSKEDKTESKVVMGGVFKKKNKQKKEKFIPNNEQSLNVYTAVPVDIEDGIPIGVRPDNSKEKNLSSSSRKSKTSTNTASYLSKLDKMLPSVPKDKPIPKVPSHKLLNSSSKSKKEEVSTVRNKRGVMV